MAKTQRTNVLTQATREGVEKDADGRGADQQHYQRGGRYSNRPISSTWASKKGTWKQRERFEGTAPLAR